MLLQNLIIYFYFRFFFPPIQFLLIWWDKIGCVLSSMPSRALHMVDLFLPINLRVSTLRVQGKEVCMSGLELVLHVQSVHTRPWVGGTQMNGRDWTLSHEKSHKQIDKWCEGVTVSVRGREEKGRPVGVGFRDGARRVAKGVEDTAMAAGITGATFSQNKKTGKDYGRKEKCHAWRVPSDIEGRFQEGRCVRSLAPGCQRGCGSELLISGQVVCSLEMWCPAETLQGGRGSRAKDWAPVSGSGLWRLKDWVGKPVRGRQRFKRSMIRHFSESQLNFEELVASVSPLWYSLEVFGTRTVSGLQFGNIGIFTGHLRDEAHQYETHMSHALLISP